MIGPKHTLKSVMQELERGLRSGEIKLRESEPERVPRAAGGVRSLQDTDKLMAAVTARLLIAIEGMPKQERSRYTEELRQALLEAGPAVDVKISHPVGAASDLVLVMGAAAIPNVTRLLSGWLGKRPDAKVALRGKRTHVVVQLKTIKDPAWLAKALELEYAG